MLGERGDSAAVLTLPYPTKRSHLSPSSSDHGLLLHEQHHQQQSQDQHGGEAQRCFLQPAEIYEHIAEAGAAKPRNSLCKEVVLGFLAGAFICFGFATCMLAAGQMSADSRHTNPGIFNLLFGAYGFPVGLSMCVINGASLFTSNIAYMTAAAIERRSSALQALWVVWLSYFTNLAGCLFLVQLMVSGDVFLHREAFTIELALKKTGSSFGATLTKGILCNWLVCMAVWQGNAARDITSKFVGIWLPVSAFVTSGYEHSIANMFVIPLAMRLGAPITLRTFLVNNLVPATIGNLIGGGVFVAMAMALGFGSWERGINAAGARVCNRLGAPARTLRFCFGAAAAEKEGGGAGAHAPGGSGSGSGRRVSASDSDCSLAARAVVTGLRGADGGGSNGGAVKSAAPHPAGAV